MARISNLTLFDDWFPMRGQHNAYEMIETHRLFA